jgi:hypothetical protein
LGEKPDFDSPQQRKWTFLKRWICQERFSYFSRIRDIAAKCRDFEVKEVRKSAEKDSLAVDGGSSEPLSSAQFPANREIYREFCKIRP